MNALTTDDENDQTPPVVCGNGDADLEVVWSGSLERAGLCSSLSTFPSPPPPFKTTENATTDGKPGAGPPADPAATLRYPPGGVEVFPAIVAGQRLPGSFAPWRNQ